MAAYHSSVCAVNDDVSNFFVFTVYNSLFYGHYECNACLKSYDTPDGFGIHFARYCTMSELSKEVSFLFSTYCLNVKERSAILKKENQYPKNHSEAGKAGQKRHAKTEKRKKSRRQYAQSAKGIKSIRENNSRYFTSHPWMEEAQLAGKTGHRIKKPTRINRKFMEQFNKQDLKGVYGGWDQDAPVNVLVVNMDKHAEKTDFVEFAATFALGKFL